MTDLEITELTNELPEWDAFVRRSPDGSPFHLTAWKGAVEAAFGHRAHYLMARRGRQLEGILPLFEIPHPLGAPALVSVPYAVYGGVCGESAAARRALVESAAALGRRLRVSHIELRQTSDLGLGLPTKSLYYTFSRALSKSEEENAAAIPRKQRRMTRQGARHGLRVTVGREHFDEFYSIYARNLRDLGSPVFPRALLRAVCDGFAEDCQILLVWQDDRIIAGVIALFHEDRVLPYYGAALRDRRQYAVNDFMYWELMCYAAKAGYRIFDFGRSREATGPYDFKRHWGFDPIPLPYQYVLIGAKAVPDLNPSNPKLRWAIEAWRHLPLPLANTIGPRLTRYLP